LQKGEGYKIEFKENVNSDLFKEMVAFANSSGGRIFLGVNDDGRIIDIEKTNDLVPKFRILHKTAIHLFHCSSVILRELLSLK